jgi:aspartyl-tRNA(Asn)/glutamyl-tRNA(Gln) amidotransferase subunit A
MTERPGLKRRELIGVGMTGLACLSLPATARDVVDEQSVPEALEWLPAWRIRELVADGSVSPVDVLEHCLARIEALDGRIGAFVQLDREGALRAAREAEKAVMRGDALGPLHGVPVALKHMIAAAGLPLETGEIADRDSVAAERIRRAGGIILGTTALAGPADMLGEARVGAANPWNPGRVAGASSSGAAACVAAGFCPVAIGSDGGGSTRLPAAWCGIVGLHPTVGRVPADHDLMRAIGRTSWSGTYGPLARDVRDSATVLSAIAGPDWRHTHSFNGPAPVYLEGLGSGASGVRIAWARDLAGAAPGENAWSDAVVDRAQRSAREFSRLGARVDEVQLELGDWYPVFTRIAAEYSAGALYPLLAAAARAWDGVRGETTPPRWSGDIEEALAARQAMAGRLLALFERYDVLATATSPVIAPTNEEYRYWLASESHSPEYTRLTGHMNLLGFPAISIPAGRVEGMPVGLQLITRPDEDAKLLRVAQAFMQAYPFAHPEIS